MKAAIFPLARVAASVGYLPSSTMHQRIEREAELNAPHQNFREGSKFYQAYEESRRAAPMPSASRRASTAMPSATSWPAPPRRQRWGGPATMVGNEGSVLVMRSSRSPQHGRAAAEKADAWRHHNMRSLSCHTEFDHDVVDTPALKQRVCRRQRVELCRPTRERERHGDFDENCGGAIMVETREFWRRENGGRARMMDAREWWTRARTVGWRAHQSPRRRS